MNVCFRTDAAPQIGSGHLMRCLTLATGIFDYIRQARNYGADDIRVGDVDEKETKIVFCMRQWPQNMSQKVVESGFAVEPIVADITVGQKAIEDFSQGGELFSDWLLDAQETVHICHKYQIDMVVVDHYLLDAKWETYVRQSGVSIFVIDDLANRAHDCAYLLDQTLGRQPAAYEPYVPESCRLLLGADYCLLRPEFLGLRQASLERRKDACLRSVLISMGGADARGLSYYAAKALAEASHLQPLQISVVIGPLSDAQKHLEALVEEFDGRVDGQDACQIKLLHNIGNMAEIMQQHDVIINAGGTTNWERLALGLPSIITNVAANQNDIVAMLVSGGLSYEVANHDVSIYQRDIVRLIAHWQEHPQEFSHACARASTIIDALGVKRVMKLLPI